MAVHHQVGQTYPLEAARHHLDGRLLLRYEQNPLGLGHKGGNQVGDSLGFSGARRPPNDHRLAGQGPVYGPVLAGIGIQDQELAFRRVNIGLIGRRVVNAGIKGIARFRHPGNGGHHIVGGKGFGVVFQVIHQRHIGIVEVADYQTRCDAEARNLGPRLFQPVQELLHAGVRRGQVFQGIVRKLHSVSSAEFLPQDRVKAGVSGQLQGKLPVGRPFGRGGQRQENNRSVGRAAAALPFPSRQSHRQEQGIRSLFLPIGLSLSGNLSKPFAGVGQLPGFGGRILGKQGGQMNAAPAQQAVQGAAADFPILCRRQVQGSGLELTVNQQRASGGAIHQLPLPLGNGLLQGNNAGRRY